MAEEQEKATGTPPEDQPPRDERGGKPADQGHVQGARARGGREQETAAESAVDETVELSSRAYEELLRERDEYLDALQRLQADFANYRKRMMRESEQLTERASAQAIQDLLPVLDNFERALKAAAEHDERLLTEGVELVYDQLRDMLARRGLCEIEAQGKPFNPEVHEAVLCQPSGEHEEGMVSQVLEKGYQLGDRVVRPAKVIVSEGKKRD